MNPKEKAQDLITKFRKAGCSSFPEAETNSAISSAIICCDELINQSEIESDQQYWRSVKEVLVGPKTKLTECASVNKGMQCMCANEGYDMTQCPHYITPLTAQPDKQGVTVKTLFDFLTVYGGSILSTGNLSAMDINQARASGRLFVDENSMGFVWMPVSKFPETVEEVQEFEKWFPLEVPLPDSLKTADFLFKKADSPSPDKQGEEPISLANLEPGSVFEYNGFYAVKSEYKTSGGAIEAIIIGSGEMFWGGTMTAEDQKKLIVKPIKINI